MKVVGCNEIPVGLWKYQGDMAAELLTRLFNTMQQCERKPGECRRSLLIFKKREYVQMCCNYKELFW